MYELATDAEASILYALMVDGVVKVYDAAGPLGREGAGPLWSCQVITHDPSPRALGTEARGEYRRWSERVGLNDPDSARKSGGTGETGEQTLRVGRILRASVSMRACSGYSRTHYGFTRVMR